MAVHSNAQALGQRAGHDPRYGGPGRIASTLGVVDPDGTPERPIARRVALFDRATLAPVRSQIADPSTGAFAFEALRTGTPFLLLAIDHARRYNAVCSDSVFAA